jgi:ATP-dependent Clp protease ATP-binding subunit ClpB
MFEETSLADQLGELLVGQSEAIEEIIPFIEAHLSGLAPEGRPAGVAMLLGASGSGKTHTVEALAEILHGSNRNVLRVDCGELQQDHEIAKLIGSPPGYLGHRETVPILTQFNLSAVSSENCDLSLLLFDEIEKASLALSRLLFGILDKATCRLGDNTKVNFERCLIFMTSNLAEDKIMRALRPNFGFEAGIVKPLDPKTLKAIALHELRKKFGTPFVNRLDTAITYQPLTREHCDWILTEILNEAGRLIVRRRGVRAFRLGVTAMARKLLLDLGTNIEFGARELKRTVERNFLRPVAVMTQRGLVSPGSLVMLDARDGQFTVQRFSGEIRAASGS